MPQLKININRMVGLLLLFVVTGCTTPAANRARFDFPQQNSPTDDSPIVTIAGTTAAVPLLQALTTEYRLHKPDTVFEILGGGSLYGETQVFHGDADFAMSTLIESPEFTPTIDAHASDVVSATQGHDKASVRLNRTPIALSGLALIVHADNPVSNLTLEELQMLYSGRILQWGELSSAQSIDAQSTNEVLLISREQESGARLLFDERILGSENLSLTALIVPTNEAIVETVQANKAAIGYVDRSYVAQWLPNAPGTTIEPTGSDALPIRVVAIDGALPESDAIFSRQYSLIYPLIIVQREVSMPEIYENGGQNFSLGNNSMQTRSTEFVQWLNSATGRQIVEQYHVVPR